MAAPDSSFLPAINRFDLLCFSKVTAVWGLIEIGSPSQALGIGRCTPHMAEEVIKPSNSLLFFILDGVFPSKTMVLCLLVVFLVRLS